MTSGQGKTTRNETEQSSRYALGKTNETYIASPTVAGVPMLMSDRSKVRIGIGSYSLV